MDNTETSWRAQAACKGQDQSLWFPTDATDDKGSRKAGGSANEAKAICATCPVRAECLAWAMDPPVMPGTAALPGTPALVGIFGGLSMENASRAGLTRAWHRKRCSGLLDLSGPGCGCEWCRISRQHFASLPTKGTGIRKAGPSRNGPNATHGVAATYAKGCHDGEGGGPCNRCRAAWVGHETLRKFLRRRNRNLASRAKATETPMVAA